MLTAESDDKAIGEGVGDGFVDGKKLYREAFWSSSSLDGVGGDTLPRVDDDVVSSVDLFVV
jgi:hypothetical protein